jgi:lysophospholipase L1-like esterase
MILHKTPGAIALEDVFGNIVTMVPIRHISIKSKWCSALFFPLSISTGAPGSNPADKIIRLNSMIKSYCDENDIVFVDYWSTMQDGHKGLDKKYSDDGVHPNLAGYKKMEPLVQEGIQKALK